MNDLTYFLSDTSIKSLRLYKRTFHDLSPLTELTELEELEISSNRHITDISPIGALVNLKKLWLTNSVREEGIEALIYSIWVCHRVIDREKKTAISMNWWHSSFHMGKVIPLST
jgi:hypothetical protein